MPSNAANERAAASARSHASASAIASEISAAPAIGAVTSCDIACARKNRRFTTGPIVARKNPDRSFG
jgi:hypothetical protein